MLPTASSPASSPRRVRTASLPAVAAASAARAEGRKDAPAGVRATPRGERSNRAVPSSRSIWAICWLMAGWATCARAAARVKFCSSATATTYLSCRSSISRSDLMASPLCLGLLAPRPARSRHVHCHSSIPGPALRTPLAASPGGVRLAGRPAHPDRAPAPPRPPPEGGAGDAAPADHGHARGADRGLRPDAPPAASHRPRGPEVRTKAPPLPEWPARTIAVLATVNVDGPHAIPVSAPVRAGDHTILLGLHRSRDSLARLRLDPQVALLVLAEDNIAFTGRGTARIAAEPMAEDPDYAAVAIDVTDVDDHRHPAFTVEAGVDRAWVDETEREALGRRVDALRVIAGWQASSTR